MIRTAQERVKTSQLFWHPRVLNKAFDLNTIAASYFSEHCSHFSSFHFWILKLRKGWNQFRTNVWSSEGEESWKAFESLITQGFIGKHWNVRAREFPHGQERKVGSRNLQSFMSQLQQGCDAEQRRRMGHLGYDKCRQLVKLSEGKRVLRGGSERLPPRLLMFWQSELLSIFYGLLEVVL